MKNWIAPLAAVALVGVSATSAFADESTAGSDEIVDDATIAAQRAALAASTEGAGFGPQAPRDLDTVAGNNERAFEASPAHTEMNLCNIHFHEGAEHRGGDFTTYAGNGNGAGYGTGYLYDGTLTEAELEPLPEEIGISRFSGLQSGDTIEVHFVHTTALVTPGPTLGSCLSEAIMNPQLRVETQVYVLVNDTEALDFTEIAALTMVDGRHQAAGIPSDTGTPIEYAGSTTGPSYNEAGSPLQVWWSVRPQVAKLDINSVATWLSGNEFDEDHAHGVRNLVMNPDLLSTIQ